MAVPAFWSSQFGVNIKSVGVPTAAEEVVIAQGSLDDGQLHRRLWQRRTGGRCRGCSIRPSGWSYYQRLIEQAAPFPPTQRVR